jgi:mannose-6-phosphate isomerase-like protein (cupin superfamily)
MNLYFPSATDKKNVFAEVAEYLSKENFRITKKDEDRPWGGFFVIDEIQSKRFIEIFFPGLDAVSISAKRVSPKILIVQPGKRLSWQYHHRRSEVWTILSKEVGISLSDTDEEKKTKIYKENDIITIKKGERHRLIGLNSWGIVAEIWQHADESNPTDEDDIVRLQDDYGR